MTPEGAILSALLDYLAAVRVWRKRINTGAFSGEHKGKKRFVRFGVSGMADIISSPPNKYGVPVFLWVEAKTATGRQSPAQKEFEQEVKENGHYYCVARSVEDLQAVLAAIKGRG